MKVINIPIVDFFNGCIKNAFYNNYELILCLLSRKADAPEIYDQINENWTSLNDLTGQRIHFVFAGVNTRIDTQDIDYVSKRDSRTFDPFRNIVYYKSIKNDEFDRISSEDFEHIKITHTNSITDIKNYFNLREKDIPSLMIIPVERSLYKKPSIIQLKNADVYGIIKKIVEFLEDPLNTYSKNKNDYCNKEKEYKEIAKRIAEFYSSHDRVFNRCISCINYLKYEINADNELQEEIEFIFNNGATRNIRMFESKTRAYVQRYIDLIKMYPELRTLTDSDLVIELNDLKKLEKILYEEKEELFRIEREQNSVLQNKIQQIPDLIKESKNLFEKADTFYMQT